MINSFVAFLSENGVQFDVLDNTLVKFSMDGLNFLFQYREEDDPQYIRLLLPKIELVEENEGEIFKRLIDVASSIKLVKGIIINNEVWLTAEQFIATKENVHQVFKRMIDTLKLGYHQYSSVANSQNQYASTSSYDE